MLLPMISFLGYKFNQILASHAPVISVRKMLCTYIAHHSVITYIVAILQLHSDINELATYSASVFKSNFGYFVVINPFIPLAYATAGNLSFHR